MYGGQSTHLPMKVNMSGVLPIIFAQSIATLPATIAAFTGHSDSASVFHLDEQTAAVRAIIRADRFSDFHTIPPHCLNRVVSSIIR